MGKNRVLKRASDALPVDAQTWADALEIASRLGWNPAGLRSSYLAAGFQVSDEAALALADALDRVFEQALNNPMQFHPVRVDMGALSLVNDFIREGGFTVGDE